MRNKAIGWAFGALVALGAGGAWVKNALERSGRDDAKKSAGIILTQQCAGVLKTAQDIAKGGLASRGDALALEIGGAYYWPADLSLESQAKNESAEKLTLFVEAFNALNKDKAVIEIVAIAPALRSFAENKYGVRVVDKNGVSSAVALLGDVDETPLGVSTVQTLSALEYGALRMK